jgi:N4-gp56 family major capsid protein
MVDAQTLSSALSAALTFNVQAQVLENLRASLVYADPALAVPGSFDEGSDTLMWVDVPDLPINTTALTEGTRPDKRALTMGTVTLSTVQYGDLVAITDVAKLLSPVEIAGIAAEHISRQAAESLDKVARDEIAAGGTTFIASLTVTTRAALTNITGDKLHVDGVGGLNILRSKMFAAKIPPFADGFYRLYVSPGQSYDLRVDTNFKEAYKYVDNMPLIRGEVGQIAGFRVIEVVNAPTFASGVTVTAAIAVGAIRGWGAGALQSLQVFHIAPGGDHTDPLAQEELIGWKCMWGVAVLNNGFYFRVESAATAV